MKRFLLSGLGILAVLHAQEPLTVETVLADRSLWPREVTVQVAHEVPIVVNGKLSGSMQAPAGRAYAVKSFTEAGLVVDAAGSPMTFPATDTDLLARAEKIRTRAAALPVSTPTPTPTPTPSPTPTPRPANAISTALDGDLVALDGKKLQNFDSSALGDKQFFAVYRSASWCGPCRKFTPQLVRWYKRHRKARDQFEIILVSSDRSEKDMVAYMVDEKMTWPALAFDKRGQRSPITGLGGRGIPDLVIVDSKGQILSRSYEGNEYVGPRKVLKDLEKLLKGS